MASTLPGMSRNRVLGGSRRRSRVGFDSRNTFEKLESRLALTTLPGFTVEHTVITPDVGTLVPELRVKATQFVNYINASGGSATITSTYRPLSYQQHFWEVAQNFAALVAMDEVYLEGRTLKTSAAVDETTQVILDKVNFEVSAHGLKIKPGGTGLAVSSPKNSRHTTNPAKAVDIAIKNYTGIDEAAKKFGLYRPYPGDPPHFELIPSQTVFVIDTTGSMWDDISAVKSRATEIINTILEKDEKSEIGIVLFRDFGDSYVATTALPFTSDASRAVSAVQRITVGGGGDFPEAVYSGLMLAISGGPGAWRAGSKSIILMGDAPAHDPEPVTGYTSATVAAAASSVGVTVGASAFSAPSTLALRGESDSFAFDLSAAESDVEPEDGFEPEELEEAVPPPLADADTGGIKFFPISIGSDSDAAANFRELADLTGGVFFSAATADDVVDAILAAVSNSPPIDITLSASAIEENAAADTLVGMLSAVDVDGDDSFTYALVSGEGDADNALFSLAGAELRVNHRVNYETQQRLAVRVRATDAGGLWVEKAFTVTVTDVADEPLVVEGVSPPAPRAYGAGQRVQFTVTLSEVVQVRGKPQIQVQAGSAIRTARYVSGSGSPVLTFQYVVGKRDNADAVALGQRFVFAKKSSIAAGAEKLLAPLPFGYAGTVAPGVRLDAAAPRTLGKVLAPGGGTYTVGQSLDFVVRFSEAVIVGGTPHIRLTGLNGARQATYVSGSGSQELTFRYVVQAGDALRGKKGLGLAQSISLPSGASIADEAGNRAVPKITAPSMKGIRIDTTTAVSGLKAGAPGGDVALPSRSPRAAAFATLG